MENQQTPECIELAYIFRNASNCYADTREENHDTVPPTLIEGDVVMAMTEDVFVTVVLDINSHHQEANAKLVEANKDLEARLKEACELIDEIDFASDNWYERREAFITKEKTK